MDEAFDSGILDALQSLHQKWTLPTQGAEDLTEEVWADLADLSGLKAEAMPVVALIIAFYRANRKYDDRQLAAPPSDTKRILRQVQDHAKSLREEWDEYVNNDPAFSEAVAKICPGDAQKFFIKIHRQLN